MHVADTVCAAPPSLKDTFDINAAQYTTALKAMPKGSSTLPVRCFLKDSPKYTKFKKSVPYVNSQVSFTGLLTSVDRNADDGAPEHFRLEVDDFVSMGKATVPAKPSPGPDTGNYSFLSSVLHCYLHFIFYR